MSLSILTATTGSENRYDFFKNSLEKSYFLTELNNIEWLVHFDSKKVPKMFSDLLKEYPNVKVSCGPKNAGLAYCRNRLLHMSETDYVLFLDDDDLLIEEEIMEAFNIVKKLKLNWLCAGLTDLFEDSQENLFMPLLDEGITIKGKPFDVWKTNISDAFPVVLNSSIIRKKCLLSIGGFASYIQVSDPDALLKVTSFYDGYVHHKPLFYYRKHSSQWTFSDEWQKIESLERQIIKDNLDSVLNV